MSRPLVFISFFQIIRTDVTDSPGEDSFPHMMVVYIFFKNFATTSFLSKNSYFQRFSDKFSFLRKIFNYWHFYKIMPVRVAGRVLEAVGRKFKM